MATIDYPAYLQQAWEDHLAPRDPDAPTVISTFAGCGGSSLGYSMAGYRELLAVEWDDLAVASFRLNFPDVPVHHGDIGALSVEECLERTGIEPGELDVLDGSPPCQGFSTAGRRRLEDDRNQLFRQYIRLLRGLRPRTLVMENVAGMVRGKMKLVFAEILRELRSCGYDVSARLLSAQYYGVPQSRQRLIFIGVREDLGVRPSHPVGRLRPVTAAKAIKGVTLPDEEREMLLAAGARYAAYKEWRLIPPGKSRAGVLGGSGFNAIKYDPNRPAYTVTKNDGHITMHGAMHWGERRRFGIAEFKRFGSFPDEFRFIDDWSAAVRAIGNSVPPLLMRAIASHIRERVLSTESPVTVEHCRGHG